MIYQAGGIQQSPPPGLILKYLPDFKEMNKNAEFAVEKDAFSLLADVEDGIDDKWWQLAEDILGEEKSAR